MPSVLAVIGLQWGDEGKGKLVDALAAQSRACARYNGGANAGHTLVVAGKKVGLHLVPSGVLNPACLNVIGNGVVLNLKILAAELDTLKSAAPDAEARLLLSTRAHLTFAFHMLADAVLEDASNGTKFNVGTTRKGIGLTYASKALRLGVRAGDMLKPWAEFEELYRREFAFFKHAFDLPDSFDPEEELRELVGLVARFKPTVKDCTTKMYELVSAKAAADPVGPYPNHELLAREHALVIEGANAIMLDASVGTYPYCTSSNVLPSAVGSGLGLCPKFITNTIGVVKAYTTRVGEGPFPSELTGAIAEHLRKRGAEYGVTTGRPRRCGWLDLALLKYSCFVAQPDCIMLTKLDVLDDFEEIKVATAYKYKSEPNKLLPEVYFPASSEELNELECVYTTLPGWKESTERLNEFEKLPAQAKEYIKFIEAQLGVPVTFVGTGAARDDIVVQK